MIVKMLQKNGRLAIIRLISIKEVELMPVITGITIKFTSTL